MHIAKEVSQVNHIKVYYNKSHLYAFLLIDLMSGNKRRNEKNGVEVLMAVTVYSLVDKFFQKC